MTWCLDSAFREIYTFLLDNFYWTRYHWKFVQIAETVSCKKIAISLQFYQKETPVQLFSCIFLKYLFLKLVNSSFFLLNIFNPANICLLKVNDKNTRKTCGICSELTIKTSEWYYWYCSSVFSVNSAQVSHVILAFLFLTLNK